MTFNLRCVFIVLLAFAGVRSAIGQEQSQQYFSVDEMPDMVSILPAPPDTMSVSFANDITRYVWGKTQRLNSERAAIAIGDAEYSLENIIRIFSEPFGLSISFEETPEIYRLLRDFTATCDNICIKPKNYYMRKRPFMLYQESTLTPEYEDVMSRNGSYPSGHTTFGWCAALILSEINPERTETLMARGYMFGESRVIVGAHWQSDVDAGMLVGAILFTKLHTSPHFKAQLEKACAEFKEKKENISTINNARNESSANTQQIYNLSGHQLSIEPSNGLFIKSGRKYLKK